jgi:hypothetical protein
MFEIAVLCLMFFAVTALYGVAYVVTELGALLVQSIRRFLCSHLQRLNWFR